MMWSMVIINLGKERKAQSPFIWELNDSHVGHVLKMAPLSAYVTNRKLQQFQSVMEDDEIGLQQFVSQLLCTLADLLGKIETIIH